MCQWIQACFLSYSELVRELGSLNYKQFYKPVGGKKWSDEINNIHKERNWPGLVGLKVDLAAGIQWPAKGHTPLPPKNI